jgi:hypothetical protein
MGPDGAGLAHSLAGPRTRFRSRPRSTGRTAETVFGVLGRGVSAEA